MPVNSFLLDDAPVKTLTKTFLGKPVVVDPFDQSKRGVQDLTKVATEQILYGNEAYILQNKLDRESINTEFQRTERPTGFIDFIADGFGNLAAGIINAVVPGSNLGDTNNPSNIAGNLIGGVGSTFVNPAGLVSGIVKNSNMSFVSSAINFIGKVAAGPIGSVGSNLLTGFANQAIPVYQQALASSAAFNAPTSMSIAETKSSPAQAAAFGNAGQSKFDTGKVLAGATSQPLPAWVKPVAIGFAVVVGLILAVKLLFKRKRR